ncbi:MAG: capsular biosynthesis protein [Bacteroidetes bacterium]|nr:MAG: capsular biosynthesis protein [Bacteroidota bacterium]
MGLFDFFIKKKAQVPVDLSVLKCDVHSHFIPGIDDGAKNIKESVALIKRFKAWGYQKVITTPHIMNDYYTNTPDIIQEGLKKVKTALEEQGVDIQIEAAAEYLSDDGLPGKIAQKNILAFGKKYLLFELPFLEEPLTVKNIIFQIQTSGFVPVLAHPERYMYWHKSFNKYVELKERGVLFQMNITSLSGHYSPEVQKTAYKLINEKMIDFAGSDCHNFNHIDLIEQTRTNPYLHKLVESGMLRNPQLL